MGLPYVLGGDARSGPWEQRQLGEVVSERNERSASGELLSISMSRGVYPTSCSDRKDNSSEDKSNYKHLAVGDIAYNSMRMWQGACGLSSFDGIISPAYTVVIPSAATDGRFLIDLFKTTEMLNTFQRNSQGLTSDTWNLKYPAFSKIKCSIPSLPEQRLIGKFFSTLDSLIAAAERQEALLRRKKQAYLRLMFPREGETEPRLRFKGFSGQWHQRQLGELYAPSREKNDGSFSAKDIISVAGMRYTSREPADSSDDYMRTYNVMRVGDIAFEGHTSNEFAFGRFVENDLGDGIVSHVFVVLRPLPGRRYDLAFWKEAIHDELLMRRILARSTKRSTMMHEIVVPDFLKETVRVPSLPEQLRIGDIFKTFDMLITVSHQRVETLQKAKSAYLQRMFL